jgi:alkaline phosphatase
MRFLKKLSIPALLAALVLCFAAVAVAADQNLYKGQPAKYVFFFIGDGLGLPQKTAAEQFTGKPLVMDSFPAQGITTTYAADRFITGSAASATALGAGQKTNIGMIGMDPTQKNVKSLAEMAQEKGMKVGVLSSVSIDHATPAAFYAHVPKRSQYHYIDHQLAESGFDLFAGGGLKDPLGKRKGIEAKGDALKKARDNGYTIVTNKADWMKLTPESGKVIAWNEWLQDSGALPYAMDQRPDKDISLPEFTAKAIELLDNPNGFFLMVEGGKIDWACHANDGAASIHNTLDFDESVAKAVEFYKKHPEETLIVVTGDHECGGLTLGFAGTKYASHFDILGGQKISFQKFTDEIWPELMKANDFEAAKPVITEYFGLKFEGDAGDVKVLAPHEVAQLEKAFNSAKAGGKEKSDNPETYLLYGGYNPLAVKLTHILDQKAGLAWTSYKHTGVPVATSAIGVGAETFNGYYDNTDVALKTMAVMGIPAQVHFLADTNQKNLAAAN